MGEAIISIVWFVIWIFVVLLSIGFVSSIAFALWMFSMFRAEDRELRGRR